MYALTDISELLSSHSKKLFTDNDAFESFEAQTEIFVCDLLGIETGSAPEGFMKQPFVWVMEFFVLNGLNNISDEMTSKVKLQFTEAQKILRAHATKQNNVTAKVGEMDDLYSAEY